MREKIIEIAIKEVGYSEEKGNKTKYGKWFNLDGVPWCGIFCSWVYAEAGKPIKKGGYIKGFAGVGTLVESYKSKITKDPKIGDLVVFDWQLDGKPDHVGIFNGWIQKEKSFKTIEGNTSPKDFSNGGMVMECERRTGLVSCFISIL